MNIHEKGRAPYELCKTPEQKKRGTQEHLHVFHKDTTQRFPCFFHVDFISFSFQPFFHLGMAWHGSTMSFCMWALLAEKNAYGIEGIAPWFFCFAMYRRCSRDGAKTQTKRTKMNTKKVEITLSHEGFLFLILLTSTAAASGRIFSIAMACPLSLSVRGNCGDDMQLRRSLLL